MSAGWWPLVSVCALALAGCAGLKEAHDSRVCWHGPWPAIWPDQCEYATIEFGCPAAVTVAAGAGEVRSAIVITRIARGMELPVVGELFSQFCPPDCIPILALEPLPADVLERDAQAPEEA